MIARADFEVDGTDLAELGKAATAWMRQLAGDGAYVVDFTLEDIHPTTITRGRPAAWRGRVRATFTPPPPPTTDRSTTP